MRRRRIPYLFEILAGLMIGVLLLGLFVLNDRQDWSLGLRLRAFFGLTPWQQVRTNDRDAMAVQLGPDGSIWALTKYHLLRQSPNGDHTRTLLTSQRYHKLFNQRSQSMASLLATGPNEVWVGGWHGALLHLRNGEWRRVLARDEPLKYRIVALGQLGEDIVLAAREGVWMGSEARFPEPVAGLVDQPASALVALPGQALAVAVGNDVWRLALDAQPNLLAEFPAEIRALASFGDAWLGGTRQGLLAHGADIELPGVVVESIAVRGEEVWVGTLRQGLWRWREGQWWQIDTPFGLPDDHVNAITFDGHGRVWLALYGAGIYTASIADLEAFWQLKMSGKP